MGTRYLTDLADVCRRAGLRVVEVGAGPSRIGDTWKRRARSSGGYDGTPSHIMVHHTASSLSADGWPDVNYCTFNSSARPVCNLYLARDGVVYVCAAGATNTNGVGVDPCGMLPKDSMNRHAISIEGGNRGTGERWPDVQCDTYLDLVDVLCAAYAIPAQRVHAHFEYAPARKIDPAGPDRWATGSGSWDMNAFRAELTRPTPPPTGDDDMTDDQARQLAELHAALVVPMPGNTDPNGTEMAVNWTTVYGMRHGQSIERRLWAIEDALGIPHT